MKTRLHFLMGFVLYVLLFAGGTGLWLHTQTQPYTRNQQLLAAVQRNDTSAALRLLDEGADANTNEAAIAAPDWFTLLTKRPPSFRVNSSAHSVLTLATRMHNNTLMAALIQRGACVNCRDSDGSVPLCKVMEWGGDFSVANSKEKLVKRELIGLVHLLLAHGADPKVCSIEGGESPLDEAWQMEDAEVTRHLLACGANMRGFRGDGMTPWSMAIFLDKVEMLRAFLDNGLALTGERGNALLNSAAGAGATQCVQLLLDRGAEVNHYDQEGWTPLICDAVYSHWDRDLKPTAQLLLQHGADIDATDHEGETALMKAVARDHVDLISLLLAHGADPNHPNKQGKTPLMLAKTLKWDDFKDVHIMALLERSKK